MDPTPSPDYTASGASENPAKYLAEAPPELLQAGLTDAHARPLVGVRSDLTGKVCASFRTAPALAWSFPVLEWARTGNSYAALALDVDRREGIERIYAAVMGSGPVPCPSVVMLRKRSKRLQVAWILDRPVHRGPLGRPAPLAKFGRISEFYREVIGADRGFRAVLVGNPIHDDYDSIFHRDAALTLTELSAPIPATYHQPRREAVTDAARNCHLVEIGLRAAGSSRRSDEAVAFEVRKANGEFIDPPPLPPEEVAGILKSIMRIRSAWRARGWHRPAWLARQADRGRRGGVASGLARRPAALQVDSAPWVAAGVSRATWYRRASLC